MARELAKQTKQLTQTGPLSKGPLAFYKEHAFALNEAVDATTSTAIWLGAYRQYLEAADAKESDAVAFADATIRKVLVSHSPIDQSALMRDKGLIGTMLLFHGAFNQFYNQFRNLQHRAAHAEDVGEFARNSGAMLGLAIGLFVIGSLVRGKGPEKDEEKAQWLFRMLLLEGAAGLIPFVGELGSTINAKVLNKRPAPRNNSLGGVGAGIAESVFTMADEEKDAKKRINAFLRSAGTVTGMPVSQVLRTGNYLFDVLSDEREARGPGDVVGGVLYGERDDQPWSIPVGAQDLISGER